MFERLTPSLVKKKKLIVIAERSNLSTRERDEKLKQ